MTSMNVYSKEQIDAKIPATTSASAGDVLTLDSNKDAIWQAPISGKTVIDITTQQQLLDYLKTAQIGDILVGENLGANNSTNKYYLGRFSAVLGYKDTNYLYFYSSGQVTVSNGTFPVHYLQYNVSANSTINNSSMLVNYFTTFGAGSTSSGFQFKTLNTLDLFAHVKVIR